MYTEHQTKEAFHRVLQWWQEGMKPISNTAFTAGLERTMAVLVETVTNDWQPIETAPKDAKILVLVGGKKEFIMYWSDEYAGWLTHPGLIWYNKHVITHWMHLPPPPKQQ